VRTDPDIVRMNALFPMWCVVSLALPVTASARSTGSTWPAPGTTTRRASGIDVASSDDSAADTVRSLSPAMTTTGTLISLRRPERSTPSNRRVNPRRCTEGLANPTWRTLTTWLRRALHPKFPLVSTTP
jgi:hypothetical protein